MSQRGIPVLRKTTKDTKTGKVSHRRSSGHFGSQTPQEKTTAEPKKDTAKNNKKAGKTGKSQNAMPSMETQTDDMTHPRDEELHKKMDLLTTRFDNVEKVCDEYKTSLEYTQEEVKDLKEENETLKDYIRELGLEVQRNTFAIERLSTKHGNLEGLVKKKNLIFEGVPEQQGGRENLHETVCALFEQMGVKKAIEYDAIYRLGQKPGKFPRPILISFMRLDDRNMIYTGRTRLRNTQHFQKVWVSEDVTAQERRFRGVIREVAKEARSQGSRCIATPNSVTIDEKKYTEMNLEELPPNVAVEKIRMKKLGDTIAYRSEHAPFSNLYKAEVPMGRHVYLCSEQAFRHTRAIENKNIGVAARIFWSRDPYEMMEMDKNLVVSEEWKAKEDFVLFKAMFKKYEANEELR